MDKRKYKTSLSARIAPFLVCIVIFAAVLYFVLGGLSDASATADAEGIRIAEESILRSVINCYATEGNYPPDYEYLKDHYGLSVDESKYIIHYEIFASNIMPNITVDPIEKGVR